MSQSEEKSEGGITIRGGYEQDLRQFHFKFESSPVFAIHSQKNGLVTLLSHNISPDQFECSIIFLIFHKGQNILKHVLIDG